MNFKEKIAKFMYGRYGLDDLYLFCFFLYIVLIILNLFFHNEILFFVELLLLIFMFYRVFSKKIYKRNLENQKFLRLKNQLLKPFFNMQRNYKDRKKYVYKKCHNCKTTLRLPLPSKQGINHVRCPECKKRITIFSFRKEKVEIIRKKERK